MEKFIKLVLVFLGIFVTLSVKGNEPLEVRMVFVGHGLEQGLSPTAKGAQQGIDEANLQGEFLGQKYSIDFLDFDPAKEISSTDNTAAIFADLGAEELMTIARSNPHTPVFNLTNRSNQLRTECLPNLLQTTPSEQMLQHALKQWHQKNPDAKSEARAWHHSFRKYAASQVNKRYTDSYSLKMDDDAYSGWIAAKIIADAVVRTSSNDGQKLLTFMQEKLVIDGAKGLKMTFRPTGQLRQLLLLVEDDKVVGEAPVRGVVDQTDMDSLSTLECACTKK